MNQLVRFGIVLGFICLAATFVLAVTYEITKPRIDAELKKEEEDALKTIMPDADSFKEKSIEGIKYFDVFKKDDLIGYCIRATGNGYNGYIRMIVGIDTDGIIKGIKILEQYETPGLGARIVEIKRGDKEPHFLKQFVGKSAKTVEVKKDIDAITGATISSKAVTDTVNKTVNEFLTKIK